MSSSDSSSDADETAEERTAEKRTAEEPTLQEDADADNALLAAAVDRPTGQTSEEKENVRPAGIAHPSPLFPPYLSQP